MKKKKTGIAISAAALILCAVLTGIILAGGRHSAPDFPAGAGTDAAWDESLGAGADAARDESTDAGADAASKGSAETETSASSGAETKGYAADGPGAEADKAGSDALPDQHAIPQTPDQHAIPQTPDEYNEICRIIDGADTGNLLLASQNDPADIYMLNITGRTLVFQSSASEKLENGMLLQITHDGSILESYPAQFGNILEILVLDYGMDNLSELYLDVLNDLWETDPGLNSDITELGVDLSQTRLSASERAAVAWAFGNAHDLFAIQGNFDELSDMGYIDKNLLQWENGCLFSITEQMQEGVYSLNAVSFDAQKWRSGNGAYFFMDCSSVQSALGRWSGYSIGGQAIS